MKRPTIEGRPCTMGELRAYVILRDGICLGFLFDRTHECAGRWGGWHRPDDRDELTLEHVPGVHGPDDVRRDDEEHCVALCSSLNVGGTPATVRRFARERLRERYPDCSGRRI